ncbi:hypothetical protein [Fischerella thermalis]|nr:hypothetical protein [Fischerella thermalis]
MARLVHWLVVSCSPLPPLLTLPTSPTFARNLLADVMQECGQIQSFL